MKRFLLLISIITLFSCTKPIILNQTMVKKPNIKMYGSVPERNFYVNKNLSDSLKLIGELTTKGSYSNTSPVIYDNYMFVSDLSGRVTAFDISKMKEIGRESYKGETPVAPVLYRTRLFFLVNQYKEVYSTLYYYDYFTNKYISQVEIPGGVSNELLFDDEDIYLLNEFGTLFKINLIGKIEWEYETNILTYCDPAMSGDLIVWGNQKGEVICFDKIKEEIIYRKKISKGFESGVTIYDDKVLIGDIEGVLYVLDLQSGGVLWRQNTFYKIKSTAVTDGRSVFIGNLNGDVFSIDLGNGEINWAKNYGGVINTTPLLFNNILLQPNLKKKILFIDTNSGEVLKIISTERRPKMSPIYFNGKIIFGIDKGKLLIYDEVE